MADCRYQECISQEISIFSLRRQLGVAPKFFFKHTLTTIAPITAAGDIDENAIWEMNPDNPAGSDPVVPPLIQAAEQALGATLDQLIDTTPQGAGATRQSFGCADECDCEKIPLRLPDGREMEYPAESSGPPPGPNAVPGPAQPMAVIERRVTIPGRGTFLLAYEIRLYGSVRRVKGRCKARS